MIHYHHVFINIFVLLHHTQKADRQTVGESERMKKATTNTKTTATATTFADLLRNYEKQAATDTTTADYTTALTDLATAVAFSVLKKCISTSADKTLTATRRDLARDLHNLNRICYASENAYETKHTADGDEYTAIADKDLHTALTKLCADTLGDGLDLMHTAILAILTETEKAKETADGLSVGFLERPYQVRRLNRKVWIKTADSVNGWETVETSAIRETYKAVRRYIESNRPVQSASDVYTYLDETATDEESGTSETIYRRFGKYADIGGEVRDYNGKETAYTADETTAKDLDALVESLNLTDRQAKVLSLRQSGYGYKAIATYLGIKQDKVWRTVQAIQTKALAIGLTPTK